ncbi:heptosyltransferase-3 [Parabacteroides sp. PF5-5]|nr:heptosyltransferase-3 [Parabacteroides sp. PF5-13]MDH6327572.1 heptosyltransferase-3 [Parabacteroides sp. PH5-41]MDH6335288.1 heptosyltransferase-3 [Parabacteroides sp. PF5-5]MDH6346351.1 heptosyltransferase-3 [Parabacteroides sp. PH5-46]MDH6361398.1 heptosyltransferase-3 [Parabacteroides sp. PH5-16]MDH6377065.1 heptosyltransferase-3 [Parabacteroides sp. PH5-33]
MQISFMSFKSTINEIRRHTLRRLTRYIGFSSGNSLLSKSSLKDVKKILVVRPNGRLGNQILITPLIQELISLFPGCEIDLFVKGGLATILFENYENVNRIIKLPKKPFKGLIRYGKVWLSLRKYHYDLVFNVTEGSSSGRLATNFAKSRLKFFNDAKDELDTIYPDYRHMAKFPVYNLRYYLSPSGLSQMDLPIPPLDIKLSPSEKLNGKKVLDSYVDPAKPTICIYTFATGTKCYSEVWWIAMYERLKAAFEPAYNILEVLPAENVSQINFQAPAYYSKDIREIASVIANSVLFFGADSGIMHLASSSLTPTAGLFSVTKIDIYQPYDNGSVAIDTNNTDFDGIIEIITNLRP